MQKSKVYFTDMHTTLEENLQQKLTRLMKIAGVDKIDFNKKFTAIKIHFGELGKSRLSASQLCKNSCGLYQKIWWQALFNGLQYLVCRREGRTHWIIWIQPILTDIRPFSTGCHILIGDGLKGTDEVLVPIEAGKYVAEAKIGRAIMDADVFISLNHFKGHELTGVGGAIKNIGMGCGSRAGKLEMHSSGKPYVDQENCIGCGTCVKNCAHGAITITTRKAFIDYGKCAGCGRCIGVCASDAVQSASDEANDILNRKIVEYTWAVLNGRPHFHISLVIDVSPYCDCHSENEHPDCSGRRNVCFIRSCRTGCRMCRCSQPSTCCFRKYPGLKMEIKIMIILQMSVRKQTGRSAIDYAIKMGLGQKEYELITNIGSFCRHSIS